MGKTRCATMETLVPVPVRLMQSYTIHQDMPVQGSL